MATRGHGLNLLSALTSTLISFACCAFVDDTNLVHSAKSAANSGKDVIGETQEVLDRWGRVLQATGGALAPSKSHWCVINFIWTGTRWACRHAR
jgi:hypothetical protein